MPNDEIINGSSQRISSSAARQLSDGDVAIRLRQRNRGNRVADGAAKPTGGSEHACCPGSDEFGSVMLVCSYALGDDGHLQAARARVCSGAGGRLGAPMM